jgi:hypothetical protein
MIFVMYFENDNVLWLQAIGSGNIETTSCCSRTDICSERVGLYMETFVHSKYDKTNTRASQKITSDCFRKVVAHVCEVASHDSLPCKQSHVWSPSVCCLYRVRYDVSCNRYSC